MMDPSHDATGLARTLAGQTGFLADLRKRAAARGGVVVLAEGEEPRVLTAALVIVELGIARPVLLGSPGAIRTRLRGQDPGGAPVDVVDPAQDERASAMAARLFERRRGKGLTQGEATVLARHPLHFGAALVGSQAADAMVAGAVHPTGEVIRAGLFHVGLAEGIRIVSGCFLMVPPTGHAVDRPLLFADSAVVPDPQEDQLVSIGKASAVTYQRLTGRLPRIACLSFSTRGSADHPSARRMARVAAALAAEGLTADGELQLDAALVPEVGAKKAPKSPVAGQADILLFPDLNAGNLGYKLAQRLGGFDAVGPIVQGLRRPVFDLSRGCSAADIVNTVAIAVLMREGKP
jgi:phosphate acetyltransferase